MTCIVHKAFVHLPPSTAILTSVQHGDVLPHLPLQNEILEEEKLNRTHLRCRTARQQYHALAAFDQRSPWSNHDVATTISMLLIGHFYPPCARSDAPRKGCAIAQIGYFTCVVVQEHQHNSIRVPEGGRRDRRRGRDRVAGSTVLLWKRGVLRKVVQADRG